MVVVVVAVVVVVFLSEKNTLNKDNKSFFYFQIEFHPRGPSGDISSIQLLS